MKIIKKIKRFLGLFLRGVADEAVDAKVEKLIKAGTEGGKELGLAISELDVFGGLMTKKEFINKLKHTIKLVELRKGWIDASIYNTKGFPKIELLLKLKKQSRERFERARRMGGEARNKEMWIAEGELKAFKKIEEVLE